MTTESTNLQGMYKALGEQDIAAHRLVVFNFGTGEQVIGEITEDVKDGGSSEIVDQTRFVKNPKRLIRLQRADQNGIAVDFMIVDYDMIESGFVYIKAPMAFWIVNDLYEAAQEHYLGLYLHHLETKKKQKAAESGIITNPGNFKLPNLRGGR